MRTRGAPENDALCGHVVHRKLCTFADTWYSGNDALCGHVVPRKWRTVRTRGTQEMAHCADTWYTGKDALLRSRGTPEMTHCASTWYIGNDALLRTRGDGEHGNGCGAAGRLRKCFPTEWLFLFSVCDKNSTFLFQLTYFLHNSHDVCKAPPIELICTSAIAYRKSKMVVYTYSTSTYFKENLIYVLPVRNCAASVPISTIHIHVSVSDLYSPRIGPPIFL
jgi:hypothetical protein